MTVADLETCERRQHNSPDDSERFAHYVKKGDVARAAVLGATVEAVCGKRWVPSRDPQRYPICPECKEIWEGLPDGE